MLLQGDTLAPYLFEIVIDYCMRQTVNGEDEQLGFTLERRKSRRVGPKPSLTLTLIEPDVVFVKFLIIHEKTPLFSGSP